MHTPVVVDNSELDVGRSAQRPPPFSIQEFGDLVSSALDLHRVPESALEFSFRSEPEHHFSLSNYHDNPPSCDTQEEPQAFNDSSMFRGAAFLRKSASQGGSLSSTPTQPESQQQAALRTMKPTRLRASTSVPSLLNKVGAHTRNERRVDAFVSPTDSSDSSDGDSDASPVVTTAPLTPATPQGQGSFRFPSIVPTWARSRKVAKEPVIIRSPTDISLAPQTTTTRRKRTKSSPMSFLNLKPLPVVPSDVPKLPVMPSDPTLISSTQSLLVQSETRHPPAASDTAGSLEGSGSEGLRSFFDDSGYEDDAEVLARIATVDTLRKMKSRPALRSLFYPSASVNGAAIPKRPSIKQNRSVERHERTWSDKLLTRSPPAIVSVLTDEKIKIFTPHKAKRATVKRHRRQGSSFAESMLSYARPALTKSRSEYGTGGAHMSAYGDENRSPAIFNDPTPKKSKSHYNQRYSPPPYPSPSSPLPPTPVLPPVGLPAVSPPNSDHLHLRDVDSVCATSGSGHDSVDSVEILSWRGLEQMRRPKASPAASDEKNYARGFPSKESIRTRLGLGPRLQMHVVSHTGIRARSKPRGIAANIFRRSQAQSQISSLRPTSGIFPSSNDLRVQTSIAKLASASLVSLRSISSLTGSRSINQSEDECEPPHRNAFELDNLIALDEDPFAADPPTPVTPVAPHNTPVDVSTPQQQSFMSLENDSRPNVSVGGKGGHRQPENFLSSDSRTPTSTNWLSASSPTLLTPPTGQGSGFRDLGSARKRLDRHSGLPPSLVVALDRGHVNRIKSTTPASPSFSADATSLTSDAGRRKRTRLHVNTVLGRARKTHQAHVDSVSGLSVTSEASAPGSQSSTPGAAGHSSSRPHSPFPFLFLRSKTTSKRNSVLSGSDFSVQEVETFPEDVQRRADTPIPDLKAVSALREVRVKDFSSPQSNVSCSATFSTAIPECEESEEVARSIVSPTAWFLESDDEIEDEVEKERSPCIGLGLKLTASPPSSLTESTRGAATADAQSVLSRKSIDRASALLRPRSVLDAEPGLPSAERENNPESETETEMNAKDSDASWPLPPIRTFVVDEETGEGWHDVEPTVEYLPNDSLIPESTKVRHSIRSMASSVRSASSCSPSSPDSKPRVASPTSQRISTEQARVIAEKLGYNLDSISRPPSQLKRQSQVRSVRSLGASVESSSPTQGRNRSSSSASAVSVSSSGTGGRSYRTCKSGFSPVRSSGSFRSSRSASSTSHSIDQTRNGSRSRSNSLRSSRSSAHHCAPSAFALAEPAPRRSSSLRRHVQVFLASQRMDQDAIPQRVILRDSSPANTMVICAESWAALMAFCRRNENLSLEAAESEEQSGRLTVTLDEIQGSPSASPSKRALQRRSDSEFDAPRMPGGLPVRSKTMHASTHLVLSLTHGESDYTQPDASRTSLLAFTTTLPTTLSQIAEQSRGSSLGAGLGPD